VPHEVVVADSSLTIDPGYYYRWRFTVPMGSSGAYLHVAVTVHSGGNRDVDLLVLTSGGETVYSERVAGFAERDITLPGPGSYELRLSNTFSLVTPKYATIKAILHYEESIVKTEQQASALAEALSGLGLALIVVGGVVALARAGKRSVEEFRKGLRGE
jgi:hypothetical protein